MKPERKLSVLIAEDDALINEGTADQLQRLGYSLAGQAYDAVQVVELAARNHPSVVVMDLQMIDPATGREDRLAGLKAARVLQERRPVAVVLLTAHESPDLIREAGQAGVSAYVVKPVRDNELDRAIAIACARFEDLLELRRLTAELQRRNEELQLALGNVRTLSGLLPICAHCKKIRDDAGYWHQVELYLQKHAEVKFSHGLCPDCYKTFYPGFRPPSQDSGTSP
jgi:AmiR/NasT family two-component response regulator